MAATAIGVCQTQGVAITTRSISSRFTRSSKAWSSEWKSAMGCDALPALSSLACVLEHLVLHGVAERGDLHARERRRSCRSANSPRPPVPMTPIRTVSLGLNFTSGHALGGGSAIARGRRRDDASARQFQ